MLRAASSTERRVGGKRSSRDGKSSSLMLLGHFCRNPCFGRSLCRMADADKRGYGEHLEGSGDSGRAQRVRKRKRAGRDTEGTDGDEANGGGQCAAGVWRNRGS